MATVTGARRRPRRWIAVVVVLAVVAVLLVAAEIAARAIVPQVVRSQIVTNLGLAQDQEIDVRIPGSSCRS